MTLAILKLSYNRIRDPTLVGGICGTAFFINENTALTANHVLSRASYKPNNGYNQCQYWLISRTNVVIPFERESLTDYPEIDTTIISFNMSQRGVKIYRFSGIPPTMGEAVYSNGYLANQMPVDKASWKTNRLVVESCDLKNAVADREGFVSSVRTLTINANDIKMNNVRGVETSFTGVVGMSGGPLIRRSTDEVIGLMSIGLPPDIPQKRTLFAISIEEIGGVLNFT